MTGTAEPDDVEGAVVIGMMRLDNSDPAFSAGLLVQPAASKRQCDHHGGICLSSAFAGPPPDHSPFSVCRSFGFTFLWRKISLWLQSPFQQDAYPVSVVITLFGGFGFRASFPKLFTTADIGSAQIRPHVRQSFGATLRGILKFGFPALDLGSFLPFCMARFTPSLASLCVFCA